LARRSVSFDRWRRSVCEGVLLGTLLTIVTLGF
jgi:hypothetical protein